MCDFGLALGIGSAVLGGMGQMQQANATATSARYNAQVAEMNAKLAERRAQDSIRRGMDEEQRQRMQTARLSGQQMAAMAANGVDLGYGSPMDVLVDTQVLGELDALTIRTNAEREAYDHRMAAMNQQGQAGLLRAQASSARQGGILAAAGTLLSGFGSAYTDFRKTSSSSIAQSASSQFRR